MRVLLVLMLVMAFVSGAMGASSRLGGPDVGTGHPAPGSLQVPVADVLICIDVDANWGLFADPTPKYSSAFVAAGATVIATCGVESSGGSISFPASVTVDNYPLVVVLTSENWWSSPQNIDPTDEAVLASYLDSGGNLLFVGQDYMYGAHTTMGTCSGFPRDYLGMDICYQEVTYGPITATVSGSTGWIFDGESVVLDSANVFMNNPFFPDCADPVATTAGYGLYYDEAGQDGVLIYNETEVFKTVWAGIELAGASTDDFNMMIELLYDWFLGITPVEETSWGHIKALYR
ncbi:MAG: hypothetical protein ABIG03_00800 [Candidatus Eisenbacteria bacterium]